MKMLILITIVIIIILLITVITYFCVKYLRKKEKYKQQKILNKFDNVWKELKYKNMAIDMLKFITEIKDIDFVVMYGTLLGTLRHGGLIPWDDDIDVCTDIKNYDKILELKPILEQYGIGITIHPKKFFKIFPLSEPKIKNYGWSWPFIDIFFYTVNDDSVKISGFDGDLIVAKKDFFPLKYAKFENIYIKIPNNSEQILDKRYKGWKNTCISSPWNHRKEEENAKPDKKLCNLLN